VAAGLPPLGLPEVAGADLTAILQGALAIVLLNYTESLGAAKAAAERTGGAIRPNQELLGLGVANLGAGLSSGFVVAGSLSQSAVSMGAGGRTQLAAVFHAALMVLTLLVLIPLFENLPHAVLGAIVVKAMIGMLDLRSFQRLRRLSLSESNIALAAFFGVLIFGVLPGVGVGVVLSLAALIYRASYPATAVLGRLPGSDVYRDLVWHPEAETLPGLLVFRFDADLFFANAGHFAASLESHIARAPQPVRAVLVDAESMSSVDATAAAMLAGLNADLREDGIALYFARVKDPVRETLRRAGLEEAIGADRFHDSVVQGVRAVAGDLARAADPGPR